MKKSKTCTKCGKEYPATLEYFHKEVRCKSGLGSRCKSCTRKYARNWRKDNRESINEYKRKYYQENHEKYCEHNRQYYQQNKEKFREYQLQWEDKNPDYRREYVKKRRAQNPRLRVSRSVSESIRYSLKDGKNGRHWETLVGYTCKDLMDHLESQFTEGMSWENYGEWHIDHRRPIADIDFADTSDPDFKVCWSLWNLQPLWGKENMSKNAKCDAPPLPLLQTVTIQKGRFDERNAVDDGKGA